jgi:tetratricopeptide (TPR) repeat protein
MEFQRAVELDQEFALAWTSIADTAALQFQYSNLDLLESTRIRRAATERALALDDQLGEAHLSKATLLEFDELYPEAESAFLRAIELSPNNAAAFQWYADFLNENAQRRREALRHAQHAVELDPLSTIMRANVADVLEGLGRYEEAEQELKYVLELDPDFAAAYSAMAALMSYTGRMDEQVQWLRQSMDLDPGRLILNSRLLWAYMDLGDTESMLEVREKMAAISPDHFITGFVDLVHAMYTGNLEGAMESARWVNQRIGRPRWFQRIMGYLNNMDANYEAARADFEISDPEFFNRATWDKGLETESQMGCYIGWIMLQTGDVDLGNELLDYTENFILNVLPRHIDHADRYDAETCLIARVQVDKALDHLETKYEHKHYGGWFFLRLHPQYEPLWGHPRFEAAMQQIEQDLAAQRANLDEGIDL